VLTIRQSRSAENDLLDIAIYTLDNWGEEQSLQDVDNIEACFQKLAANPLLGRSCAHLGRGLRRWEHGRHITQTKVFRILHERRLPIFPSA
jgi:plasmid stabilization system protein ParE